MAMPFDEPENIVWQTRRWPQTDHEDALAGALETILGDEVHDLPSIVARLNEMGLRTEEGEAWTEERFAAEMHRLGA